jgi:hypothetical protein
MKEWMDMYHVSADRVVATLQYLAVHGLLALASFQVQEPK